MKFLKRKIVALKMLLLHENKQHNIPKSRCSQIKFYHKESINDSKKLKINKKSAIITSIVALFLNTQYVFAIDKIEGGNVTITSLGDIIKKLATQIQIFGIVLSFIALVVFVIQFIIGDDETKQRKKKTILYTLGGVALLILVPSLINFIIDTLNK